MKLDEKLGEIESLARYAHLHYLRVEAAVARATIDEIQAHYAYLHGVMPEDVLADPRFPWHPAYKYGDAKKCCENCEELEMALSVDMIGAGAGHRLAASFPDMGELVYAG